MPDFIQSFDYYFFTRINSQWVSPFLDNIFIAIRNKYFWAPLYIFLVFFLLSNFRKKGFYLILFLILTVLISDQLSSTVIKPLVHRLRPCNDMFLVHQIRVLIGCSSSFSFPSSHATNHFAVALFLINILSRKYIWFIPLALSWAFAISYAQVYVGLHFPFDILCGAVLGALIGYYTGEFSKRILKL